MSRNGTETESEGIQVVLEVTDHDSLLELMEMLHECELSIKTEAITEANLSSQMTATVELDILTGKQRETLELAIKQGYYNRPRDANLTDLAENLDISKSAVSQRLNAAETKLIKTTLERYV